MPRLHDPGRGTGCCRGRQDRGGTQRRETLPTRVWNVLGGRGVRGGHAIPTSTPNPVNRKNQLIRCFFKYRIYTLEPILAAVNPTKVSVKPRLLSSNSSELSDPRDTCVVGLVGLIQWPADS